MGKFSETWNVFPHQINKFPNGSCSNPQSSCRTFSVLYNMEKRRSKGPREELKQGTNINIFNTLCWYSGQQEIMYSFMTDRCVPDIWIILSFSYLKYFLFFVTITEFPTSKGEKKKKKVTNKITLNTRMIRNVIVSWRWFGEKGCIFLSTLYFASLFFQWLSKWSSFQTVLSPSLKTHTETLRGR